MVASEEQPGEVSRYGEGGDEAASMREAAARAKKGAGSAQTPGRRVTGKSETGEPTPEQAPRETHGVADHRPAKA